MRLPRKTSIALAAALALGGVVPASAQHGGNGYLFHEPQVRLSFRMGYDHALANSDVFDEAVTDLTLNKKDFSGLTLGGEAAFALTSRIDLSVDVGYSRAKSGSEFRHFEDNNNLPIEQTTTFERVPLTANVRFYLTEPGRRVGRLAWIPNKVVPWVGAGGGMMWYRFRQQGDFVDFQTLNVFASDINSTDWTPTAQGMAGVDISLSPMVALRAESRYVWARTKLSQDFSGFDPIDLSGVQATLGLTFRL
jgi:Outer membrane protein beta-barrel domain